MKIIEKRFQISADDTVLEFAGCWQHARAQAIWLWNTPDYHGMTIWIFDSMARRGRPELWKIIGGEPQAERVKGDKSADENPEKVVASLRAEAGRLRSALLVIRNSCLPDHGSFEAWADWCQRTAEEATTLESQR